MSFVVAGLGSLIKLCVMVLLQDNYERTENSLSLWVNEAKDLPPKKRYYCEVHLDGTLFARTSSRTVGKSSSVPGNDCGSNAVGMSSGGSGSSGGCQLFWGEFFELDNLPPVKQITLHLFRDEDPKKKRHSKDEIISYPLGSVALSLANIKGRVFQEKWYPIIPFKPPGTAGAKEQLGAQASLRVKARFQNLQVLPIERYKEFAEYVTLGYVEMCSNLEPLLNVKDKEELAGALVHVLQSIGKAKVCTRRYSRLLIAPKHIYRKYLHMFFCCCCFFVAITLPAVC